jgi:GTPase SAR1 family protein
LYHSFLQGRYRESWSFFYPEVDGIFFVVDSSDLERLSVAQEILQEISRHPGLKDRRIPLVILSNKQDLTDSVDEL